MSENTLSLIAFIKVIVVAGFAFLYSSGGINGKWKRRFLGPTLLTIAVVGLALWQGTFSWYYLISFPLLVGALTLPYGGDSTHEKVIKRAVYALALCVAVLPIAFVSEQWILYWLHCFMTIIVIIVLGVLNPVIARFEETLIGVFIVLLPIFMIGKKEKKDGDNS